MEVTEACGRAVGKALSTLNRLRAMGITVAVDDFGIEYSTLGRISPIPFDRLKIDRSFVRPEDNAEGGPHVLLENIINLGRQMGVSMVAEGVETEEEAACSRAWAASTGSGSILPAHARAGRDPAAFQLAACGTRPKRRRRMW